MASEPCSLALRRGGLTHILDMSIAVQNGDCCALFGDLGAILSFGLLVAKALVNNSHRRSSDTL